MRALRKLNSRSGFSLAETLLTTLILLLVSVIMVNGIPVAKQAYEKVVVAANAKVLLSTAITTLRDELSTAQRISWTNTDPTTISYYSADRGTTSTISLSKAEETKGTIMLQEYHDYSGGSSGGANIFDILGIVDTTKAQAEERQLITAEASNKNLYVTYEMIEPKKDSTTGKIESIDIKGLKVLRKGISGADPLAVMGPETGGALTVKVVSGEGDFTHAAPASE